MLLQPPVTSHHHRCCRDKTTESTWDLKERLSTRSLVVTSCLQKHNSPCMAMSCFSDGRSQHPPKTPQIHRACFPCLSPKTRCEDVTSGGCSRCRTKHLQSSLLEGTLNPFPSTQAANGVSTSEIHELLYRLVQVEAASRLLEPPVREH